MDELSIVAAGLSLLGLVYSVLQTASTLRSQVRESPGGSELELRIDGEVITIDVSDLDREDTGKIERAIESVKAAKARERQPIAA